MAQMISYVTYLVHEYDEAIAFFLHTDDFDGYYNSLKEKGITFLETPRSEVYGRVVVFADLYGNKWDLLEMKSSGDSRP